jgi:CBS domain-containing protein
MSFESILVSSIMTKKVIVQTDDQTIQAVSNTMYENNIGNVLIVKNYVAQDSFKQDKVVGIITERDVVRIVGSFDPTLYHLPVRELMSKPIVSITPTCSLKDAMETMQLKNIRRLPVIEQEGKLVGIITSRDIFKVIIKNQDTMSTFINLIPLSGELYERFTQYWSDDILHKTR